MVTVGLEPSDVTTRLERGNLNGDDVAGGRDLGFANRSSPSPIAEPAPHGNFRPNYLPMPVPRYRAGY